MTLQADDSEPITAEFPFTPDNYVSDPGALMAVDIAAETHQGHVRSNNEDHYLVMRFGRSLQTLLTNIDPTLLAPSYDLTGYGLLVADGLGRMAAGEVASRIALTRLVELVVDTPDWILGFKDIEYSKKIQRRMADRFLQIDETLKEQGDSNVALTGMGTTLTAVATLGRDMVIGHVGDSRAYLFREGTLRQLTTDHTVAQDLIAAGISDGSDPQYRAMHHILTASLGSLSSRIQPEVQRLRLNYQDQLLLCTDGLTAMVDDKAIASVLRDARSSEQACQDLTRAALTAGGFDNLTVVLARFGPRSSD